MTPRQWLETTVDEEHAEELIKHRQRLRKPMTDFAAKLLARKLAACPDPNAAAELMIEKGWQSVEPSWVQNSVQRSQQRTSVGSVFGNLAAQMESNNGDELRRIQGDEGIREAFPLLSFAFEQSK